MNKFYDSADLARQRDPVTGWSLAEIRVHVKSLIRRSRIPRYPVLRLELADLHDRIMNAGEHAVRGILTLWAEELAAHSGMTDAA